MSTIYLDEQGSALHKQGECLVVEKDGVTLAEIPLAQLDRLIIVGNIDISVPTLAFLLDKGVPTTFISTHGKLRGMLQPLPSKNIPLRLAQFQRHTEESFRLALSKSLVTAKIQNNRVLLMRNQRNHPELNLEDAVKNLARISGKVSEAQSVGEVFGYEGSAARCYFAAYGQLMRRGFQFAQRSRRPPKDPVNSLLSLGYTLLVNEILAAVFAVGFDPYLGFFHGVDYGRPSLAVDLMEEFRFLIDSMTLTLINKEILTEEDFYTRDDGSFYLKEQGREVFFRHYEGRLRSKVLYPYTKEKIDYRRVFWQQAQHLARAVEQGEPYKPYLIR